jgi:hypothetical protein
MVFGIVLLIGWSVLYPDLWWLGLTGGVFATVGFCQMAGWVPSI